MLSVNRLGKFYGDQHALIDVSFDIAPGEIVALLGANGSGKTTTINSICRLLDWEQGEIFFEEKNVRKSSDYLRNIGAVLGGCRNTNWRLTAAQNALYFSRLRGVSKKDSRANITQLEEQLGLAQYHDREVGKLSTGNKQKAALLSALGYQPKLLLLDEPTLGLDMNTVSELRSIIVDQSQRLNQSFLITSHDMAFIDEICDRVIVLDEGKVVYAGGIDTLKKRLFHYELRIELDAGQSNQLSEEITKMWSGKVQHEQRGDLIIVRYDIPEQAFATINWMSQQHFNPKSLSITPLSIETAYRSLINLEAKQ
jgi:ABC-2 type transport system ATP-binding protein